MGKGAFDEKGQRQTLPLISYVELLNLSIFAPRVAPKAFGQLDLALPPLIQHKIRHFSR